MSNMNREVQKLLKQLKATQKKFQSSIQAKNWMEEARRYAEVQKKEVSKLLSSDAKKVKTFLEREKKELDRIQKKIPAEVKKWQSYVNSQKKEAEKLLKKVKRLAKTNLKTTTKKKKKTTKKKVAKKKTAAKKKKATKKK